MVTALELSNMVIAQVRRAMPIGAYNDVVEEECDPKTGQWQKTPKQKWAHAITEGYRNGTLFWQKDNQTSKWILQQGSQSHPIFKAQAHFSNIYNQQEVKYIDRAISAATHMTGNCGEMASLALIFLCKKLFEIKNFSNNFSFCLVGGKKFDHAMAIVSIDNEHVICDPWLRESFVIGPSYHLPLKFEQLLKQRGRDVWTGLSRAPNAQQGPNVSGCCNFYITVENRVYAQRLLQLYESFYQEKTAVVSGSAPWMSQCVFDHFRFLDPLGLNWMGGELYEQYEFLLKQKNLNHFERENIKRIHIYLERYEFKFIKNEEQLVRSMRFLAYLSQNRKFLLKQSVSIVIKYLFEIKYINSRLAQDFVTVYQSQQKAYRNLIDNFFVEVMENPKNEFLFKDEWDNQSARYPKECSPDRKRWFRKLPPLMKKSLYFTYHNNFNNDSLESYNCQFDRNGDLKISNESLGLAFDHSNLDLASMIVLSSDFQKIKKEELLAYCQGEVLQKIISQTDDRIIARYDEELRRYLADKGQSLEDQIEAHLNIGRALFLAVLTLFPLDSHALSSLPLRLWEDFLLWSLKVQPEAVFFAAHVHDDWRNRLLGLYNGTKFQLLNNINPSMKVDDFLVTSCYSVLVLTQWGVFSVDNPGTIWQLSRSIGFHEATPAAVQQKAKDLRLMALNAMIKCGSFSGLNVEEMKEAYGYIKQQNLVPICQAAYYHGDSQKILQGLICQMMFLAEQSGNPQEFLELNPELQPIFHHTRVFGEYLVHKPQAFVPPLNQIIEALTLPHAVVAVYDYCLDTGRLSRPNAISMSPEQETLLGLLKEQVEKLSKNNPQAFFSKYHAILLPLLNHHRSWYGRCWQAIGPNGREPSTRSALRAIEYAPRTQ